MKRYLDELNFVGFFCTIITVVFFILFLVARKGFTTDYSTTIKVLSLGIFMFSAPISFFSFLQSRYPASEQHASFSLPGISLIVLLFLSLAGLLTSLIHIDFSYIYIIASIFFVLSNLKQVFLYRRFKRRYLVLTVLFIIFSIWLSSIAWGLGFQNPLFLENLLTGHAYQDSLFHASIIQMIRTYHVPSTGLDGIPYINNHWGSHWIFAQFSSLIHINPLNFIQLGYPVIFFPFFIFCFLTFILTYRKKMKIDLEFNTPFWIFLIISFIGFFPVAIVGILEFFLFFSESYLLSVSFTFLFMSLLLTVSTHKSDLRNFHILVLLIMLFIIGLVKISTLWIVFCVWLYTFIRLKLYKKIKYVFIFMVIAILSAIVFKLVNSKYGSSSFQISLVDFIKNSVIPPWKPFYIPINYFWSGLYIFLKLRQIKVVNLHDLGETLKGKKILDIEMLVILCIVGFLPGALIYMPAGGTFYFADFQRWVAISLILANLPLFFQFRFSDFRITNFAVGKIKLTTIFILFISLSLISSFVMINFRMPILNFIFRNKIIRADIKRLIKTGAYAEKQQMIDTLTSLELIPQEQKMQTALYIPRTNKYFWELLSCGANPFIAPALTGMAMVWGQPNSNCNTLAFGYEYYEKVYPSENINRGQINCRALNAKGFSRLIIIPTNKKNDIRNISCK